MQDKPHNLTHPTITNTGVRILSLDGGGIRGIFSAACLAHIEKHAKCRLIEHVDLLTGTSTGSIIALGLAAGLSAQEVLEAYRQAGPLIFKRPANLANKFRSPAHDNKALRDWLKQTFGEKTLGDSKKPIAIPTLDVETGQTKVFKTNHHDNLHSGGEKKMWEIALASAAAPTYLPAVQIGDRGAYLDGGLWANNPSVVGIIEAHRYLAASLDSIRLLSIGTGRRKLWLTFPEVHKRGLMFWGSRIVDLVFDAQAVATNNQAKLLLSENNYLRIDVELPRNIPLDDVRSINTLEHLGASEGEKQLKAVERLLATPKQTHR